jgi:hypothetical protein
MCGLGVEAKLRGRLFEGLGLGTRDQQLPWTVEIDVGGRVLAVECVGWPHGYGRDQRAGPLSVVEELSQIF